jgi:RNA polymerase sigma-70 factor (ECF subfamily)
MLWRAAAAVFLAVLATLREGGEPPDAALVARLATKDVRAFESIYDRHSRAIYSLVYRILQQAATAEEVVQDIFLQLWRNAASYESSRGPFLPWLLTLARNRALDCLRLRSEQQRRREMQTELPETLPAVITAPDYEARLDEQQVAGRVRALMGALAPQQRRAIELAYFEEMSHSEIASALQEPLGTVKSWIRNGLLHLKEGLQATS